MRICIFGAGAIGGLIGARLALAGESDVSLVARGAHLAAIRERGIRLVHPDGKETGVKIRASDDVAELGRQDYVILSTKAHSVPSLLDPLASLMDSHTAVVMAQNGVPWWYFYGLEGPWRNRRIEAVDPGGRTWDRIGPERAIGCAVHPAAGVVAPGIVQHRAEDYLPIGEPCGQSSERVRALSTALTKAGFNAPILTQIRDEIWMKLFGNVSLSPVSALTGATLDVITRDPGTRASVRRIMVEAQAVAAAVGVRSCMDVDRIIARAAEVGAHKTSMLQDLEAGRPVEIDALVTAVQELGRLANTPTPTIDVVLALVRQKARLAGCYS